MVVIGSLLFLKPKWLAYNVEKNGSIVTMKIISLPNYCGRTKGSYNMDALYGDQVFTKKIPTGYCNTHRVGELIEMKYLEGQESILFPNEKTRDDFIVIGIFFLVGLIAIVYGIFEKRKR
jgi:hypothetical protein